MADYYRNFDILVNWTELAISMKANGLSYEEDRHEVEMEIYAGMRAAMSNIIANATEEVAEKKKEKTEAS